MIFLLVAIFLTACSDKNENCCTNIDIGINIKYLNENNENLLELEDGIREEDLTVFHLIDGEWVAYFEANLDSPQGIKVIDRADGKYLRLFPSTTTDAQNLSQTKIVFSTTDSDVIKTEIDSNGSNTTLTKIWYNETLEWDTNQSERIIEIVK